MKISGYELLGELGKGSGGYVVKARQVRLNRLVAIKVLVPEDQSDGDRVNRFLREARAGAKLRHQNLVGLFDVGRAESGEDFLVLEFVEGLSLEKLLERQGRIPERVALLICYGAARALTELESNGIVHRDVKPANVLLSWEGVPKLADLGLAKGDDLASRTQTGRILGTPMYIAPEAVTGAAVDTRTDLYSLGATLFHCVCGETPFKGKGIWHLLNERQSARVPDPRTKNPDVSKAMAKLIAGLAALDPDERYPSAEAACLDMRRVYEGGNPWGPRVAAERLAELGASSDDLGGDEVAEYLAPVQTTIAAATLDVEPRSVLAPPSPTPEATADEEGLLFRLTVREDGRKIHEQTYDQDEVTIGRTRASDLSLEHVTVSRQHAKLVREGTTLKLVAYSTPNGTKLNGEPLAGEAPVGSSDAILISDRFAISLIVADPGLHLEEAESVGDAGMTYGVGPETHTKPVAGRGSLGSDRQTRAQGSDRQARAQGSDRQARAQGSDRQARAQGSDRQARAQGSDRHAQKVGSGRSAAEVGSSGPRLVVDLEGAGGPCSLEDVRIAVNGFEALISRPIALGRKCEVRIRHPILSRPILLATVVTGCEPSAGRFSLSAAFSQANVMQRMKIRRVQAAERCARVVVRGRVVGFCAERQGGWTIFDDTTSRVAILEASNGRIRACLMGEGHEDSVRMLSTDRLTRAIKIAMDLEDEPLLLPPEADEWEPIHDGGTKGHETSRPAMRFHKVLTSFAHVGFLTVTSVDEAWTVFDGAWRELANLWPQQDGSCKVHPLMLPGSPFVDHVKCPSLEAGIAFALTLPELPRLEPPIQPWATGGFM